VIVSFSDADTEALFQGRRVPKFVNIMHVATRKLAMLDEAKELRDLASPPNNRLESLKGDRKGQFSIRVNEQWRICFKWSANGPFNVEIVDYH
jgi:proteic killer suppression protein